MVSTFHAFLATVLVFCLYLVAASTVKHRWNNKLSLNPLKIIADITGRASLSNIQVFFFTLIVVWLAIYWVTKEGQLIPFHNSVLYLLGIAVVGAGSGKAVDTSRLRVSGENWSWAKKKGWIKNDFTRGSSKRVPKLGDLITTEQGFDVARFQTVGFSLVVGLSLLYNGAIGASAESFSMFVIDDTYLALVGISQGVFVGGKLVGGNLVADLNRKLGEVRSLEVAFKTAVSKSTTWLNTESSSRNMILAREQCAPSEYSAYISSATEAGEMVSYLTGNRVEETMVEVELPPF